MGEAGDLPEGPLPSDPKDADQIIFERAQKLVNSKSDQQHKLHVSGEGLVLAEDLADLSNDTEQVALADANAGDIVWFTTESGTTGYLSIKEPYVREGDDISQMKTGRGEFLITRREGHPLGDQRGTGYIFGATIGGMLKKDRILKGTNLEYKLILDGGVEKPYTTTPVTDMGLIKAEKLK